MAYYGGYGLYQPCYAPSACPPALFDQYPIGANLAVGMDAGFWFGAFGGLQGSVAVLTQAQLFSNVGTPIDGIRAVVRIPCNQITFVSQ